MMANVDGLLGHQVVSVVRDPAKVSAQPNLTVVKCDVNDGDVTGAISGCDIVVNAYAPPMGSEQELIGVTERLLAACKAAGVQRFVMVGGAGGLSMPNRELVINQAWFAKEWVPIAQAHIDALERVRASDINWTTFSPAGLFAPGERTGKYRLGGENLVMDAKYASVISMEDYAIALVDEIETPRHERLRFTAAY